MSDDAADGDVERYGEVFSFPIIKYLNQSH